MDIRMQVMKEIKQDIEHGRDQSKPGLGIGCQAMADTLRSQTRVTIERAVSMNRRSFQVPLRHSFKFAGGPDFADEA
jgi:hypothetical protein